MKKKMTRCSVTNCDNYSKKETEYCNEHEYQKYAEWCSKEIVNTKFCVEDEL